MATSRTSAATRCLSVAVTFLSISVVGLVAILVWREIYATPGQSATYRPSNDSVLEAFPGYFRTPEEQRSYKAASQEVIGQPDNVYNVSSNYTACFQDCSPTTYAPYRRLTTSSSASAYPSAQTSDSGSVCSMDKSPGQQLTFHACCISRITFYTPDELPAAAVNTASGTRLKIVQLPGMKQYFEKEECCQASGCSTCQCSQTYRIVQAVVESENSIPKRRIDLVKVPGCCKCINRTFG